MCIERDASQWGLAESDLESQTNIFKDSCGIFTCKLLEEGFLFLFFNAVIVQLLGGDPPP